MNVFITGGSRGIGAAAVRLFLAEGHSVAFTYLKSGAEAETLEALGARAYRSDSSSWSGTEDFISRASRDVGEPDVLICNAGEEYIGLFQLMSEEDWQRVIAADLSGPAGACRAVIPHMLRRGGGSIILVSSMWGQVGASCEAAYSAAKAGLIGLTKALAKELGPSNIRVNCVAPGVIDTDMNRHLGEETLRELAEETPLGRLGTAREVADAMLFLAGAGFMTGQVIAPNGGFVI